jgi:hypothetical protein
MSFIDLKFFPGIRQSFSLMHEEGVHEFRKNDICPIDGLSPLSRIRVPKMRRSIQRQSQGDKLYLLGSVSLYGLRPAYLILQVLSVTLFEKTPISQALSNASYTNQENCPSNQLNLFD